MGDQIHRGFRHPQTWLRSESELSEKSLKLSAVTRAHPCCLSTFCSAGAALFLWEACKTARDAGPVAPCWEKWEKGAKDGAGGAGGERDGVSMEGATPRSLAKSRRSAWFREQMSIPGAMLL